MGLLLGLVVCCFCAMWKATERPARPAPIITTSFGIAALLLLISLSAVDDDGYGLLSLIMLVAILQLNGLFDEENVGVLIDLVVVVVVMKEKA